MRGKLAKDTAGFKILRLIPAHAGKTHGKHAISRPSGAHPRACGENRFGSALSSVTRGSSPRMRGKLLDGPRLFARGRLIPAHAGKTTPAKSPASWARAHPRACGENAAQAADSGNGEGSSPRMRGKQEFLLLPPAYRRLIPAHAGKTRPSASCIRSRRAHPRACGENMNISTAASLPPGSSPRMRGKPLWLGDGG